MRRTLSLGRTCRCGRPSDNCELCRVCQVRKSRGALFEPGSSCAACGLADMRVLRWLALLDGRVPACGNCGTLAGRRRLTLAELVAEVLVTAWAPRRLANTHAEIPTPASSELRVA